MGTGVAGFSTYQHFSELADPLDTQEGVLSPQTRRQRAQANLGLQVPSTIGGAARMTMPVPATAADTAVLTAAQILNGVIRGTPTAAAAYTLPLASALDTAVGPTFPVGDAFEFSVINLAATATFDITMTTNTGWTLAGPVVVGAGASAAGDGAEYTSGIFRARKTGTAAWTLYRVG